ncbi:unnamed protein product, partial [Bubo scandiacus]
SMAEYGTQELFHCSWTARAEAEQRAKLLQNHRITESSRLEKTLKIIQSNH